ncbi:aromatic acid exporter family protein [Angustibacter sp. Root456]|uniref:FUSC family protein n=1 Tax=Angustibacter sp. Root456 TaxID=1736539 RepID=UPI0006FE5B63|nr:FUSC family protein [Angustibacter sp. Root456]KQX66267.1 hypothetical protein ASD06_07895 [Angustibacter sp. Root456]
MSRLAEQRAVVRRLRDTGGASRLVRRFILHARTQLAAKATLAAVLAWLAAASFAGSDIEKFRYYAPLGAVVTTYPSIASTVRQSWHAVLSVGVGATLGLVVHAWLSDTVVALVVVVATGIAVAGWQALGDQSSYVPIVALLVVAIGGHHPGEYALAYLSFTGMGAAIGIIVSLALPSTRLSPGHDAVRRVERLLADRIDEIADVLRSGEPPEREEWERRLGALAPSMSRMRLRVDEAAEAQRGNPRAKWRGYPAERQVKVARGLERVDALVEDLVEMLARTYRDDLPQTPLAPPLAERAGEALDRLSDLVRHYHRSLDPDADAVRAAREAVDDLMQEFSHVPNDPDDLALVGAVVATIQRCLDSVTPARREPSSQS